MHEELRPLLYALGDSRTGPDMLLAYPFTEHLPRDVVNVLHSAVAWARRQGLATQDSVTLQLLQRDGPSPAPERLAVGAIYDLVRHDLIELDLLADADEGLRSSRVLQRYPALREHFDKHDLLLGNAPVDFRADRVVFRDAAFSYHRTLDVLRLPLLLETMLDIRRRSPDRRWGIAVDHLWIHPVAMAESLMKAHWYGPPFDLQRLARVLQLRQPQATVHRRLPGREWIGVIPLDRIEAFWNRIDGDLIELQLEELVPLETNSGCSLIYTRYLHAQWNTHAGSFVHSDGALKLYTPDEYETRFYQCLPQVPRVRKRKLWRSDAKLPVDVWGTLVGQFYHHNELVYEYLSGNVYER